MKILIIANHLLTPEISSGGDRIFVEMVKRWKKWGADIVLAAPEIAIDDCASEISTEERITISRSRLDKFHQKAIWTILPLYFYRTAKILRLLKSVRANIIFTPGDFFCNVIPAFYLKRKFSVKWAANIYHINESPFIRKGNSFFASAASFVLQRFSFLLIKRSADVIFLNNQEVKDDLVKMGFDQQRLFVTGLGGVDLNKIKNQSAPGGSKFEGCFLGRLNPTKGIFDLPKIWKRVVEKIPKTKLIIIGGGEKWRGQLHSQIKDLGLSENIKVTGFVSEEEKYKLLSQSKVFVFPSYEEGWGIVVAEAMATGLPVVAYNLPAYKEIFPDAIMSVRTGDIDALSNSVLKLLQDTSEYEIWQKKGYNAVSRYDLDAIAETQWEIIRSLE